LKILQKIFYGLALLFIPLAIILDKIGGVPQPLLFFLAAVPILPLAAILVQATERRTTPWPVSMPHEETKGART
jgi:hypothetical protein